MSAKVDCDRLLVDYMEKMREMQTARQAATDARIKSVHAQALHDRTWPLPLRTIRGELRDKVEKADLIASRQDAVAQNANKELDEMRAKMHQCKFTGVAAKRTWDFFRYKY